MCFSAPVSLCAGAVLTGIGVASIKKAQSPSQVLFAGIPLIFAAQQITEGILWLIISNPAYEGLQHITTFAFIFFAQVLWPAWVPFSILKLESEQKRKPLLRVIFGIGVLVSLYLLYSLCYYDVEAKIVSQHIVYSFDYPDFLMSLTGVL